MAATTLYRGGRCLTMADPDDRSASAEAVVVGADGTIAFVGDEVDARDVAGVDARVVDLDGGLLLPGFVDSHTHLIMLGEALGGVALTDAGDLGEIQRRLRAAREASPDAPRLLGQGWLFDAVGEGHPTAAMLDAAVGDVPVYLNANDYHSCWVSTAALAELGVTRDTPDPAGGRIGRRADGEPDGMLYETAATQHAWAFLARAQTDEQRDAALERAIDAYLAAGVTTVVDMAFDEDALGAVDRAAARRGGTLPLTVVAHWFVDSTGDPAADLAQVDRAIELAARPDAPWLRVTGIKLVLDGVIDACTAAMRHPYADGSNAEPIWSLHDARPVVAAADAAGLQVALHAIGDAASDLALDALEHAVSTNGPDAPGGPPRRHRIEHLEHAGPEIPARMAALGVTASMQPVHADPAVRPNWTAMLGDERAEHGFAWPDYTEAGVLLAFSTDAPTAPHPALPNLHVATTRRSALDPSLPAAEPAMAVPLAEALAHATVDAATSCREEHRRGSLQVGLVADLAVLDRDVLAHDPASGVLLEAQVVRTIVAGETVHDRDALGSDAHGSGAHVSDAGRDA